MDLVVLALLFWSAIASALAFWWSPVGPGRSTATLEDLAERIELTELVARRRVSREELSAVKNQKDLARRLLSDMRQDVVARLGRGNCFAVTRKDVPSKPHVEYEMRAMVALDAYTTPTPTEIISDTDYRTPTKGPPEPAEGNATFTATTRAGPTRP